MKGKLNFNGHRFSLHFLFMIVTVGNFFCIFLINCSRTKVEAIIVNVSVFMQNYTWSVLTLSEFYALEFLVLLDVNFSPSQVANALKWRQFTAKSQM